MRKIYHIRKIIIFILAIGFSYNQHQYENLVSMLSDVHPFYDDIQPGFIESNYSDDVITSIFWFDQDSIKFSKIFHYDDNQELYLITEYRETKMLKEYFLNNHIKSNQFINYLFGDNFTAYNNGYITEIQYNKDGFPTMFQINSMQNDYIGHIILNYNNENNTIREVWFHGDNKIKEFYISEGSIAQIVKK